MDLKALRNDLKEKLERAIRKKAEDNYFSRLGGYEVKMEIDIDLPSPPSGTFLEDALFGTGREKELKYISDLLENVISYMEAWDIDEIDGCPLKEFYRFRDRAKELLENDSSDECDYPIAIHWCAQISKK
jgi:hypothetical protein